MRAGSNTKTKFKTDDYSTPPESFDLLFKYISRDKINWDPFYFDGRLNVPEDTVFIHEDKDFFQYEPIRYDFIISNPPYSIKQKIFERCEKLNKPYALLLPMDTMERQYMNDIMKTRDVTIIIPRIRYKFNDNNFTPPFKVCWFCIGFKLDSQLLFE